jgi:hypothetical protein
MIIYLIHIAMKKFTHRVFPEMIILLVMALTGHSQETYQYLLKQDFHALQLTAPDLVQVQNNQGQTGEFVTRQVPPTTCGNQGSAPGYFFEDDAGLLFHNPSSFINQEYTVAFNFQFDEFEPPSWIRIMSFTHYDDVGIYILLTGIPDEGSLYFWPYGEVGTPGYFNTVDFYQLILVRNAAGLINIYVNGSEFAQYDDSESQAYIPQDTTNFIIWFRDDPSVAANEAAPGFVSDIRIANYPWTLDQVQGAWAAFCSSLLAVGPSKEPSATGIYPNPAADMINLDLPSGSGPVEAVIYDITGRVISKESCTDRFTADVSAFRPGVYLVRVTGKDIQKVYSFVKR